jgi:transcriptional regulator with XRE-family HTH domain
MIGRRDTGAVSTRTTRLANGLAIGREIRIAIGREIRSSRHAAGLSLRQAGAAVGMSHAQLGRIERGVLVNVTIDQLSRAAAAVGLRLVVRAYPDGDPVVDRAQLALLGRLRDRLPASATIRFEVPLPIAGDRRAWDAIVEVGGSRFAVEAETRIWDVQAVTRRIALKQRDDGIAAVVLLAGDTAANRRTLRDHGDALAGQFPLDGRAVLRAVRAGRVPAANGILVL